jgi:ABC-2 type transport system permease protein
VNFLRETALIFRRQLGMSLRTPIWVVVGLAQPIMYLTFFGPLVERVLVQADPGIGSTAAWQVFVPGLLVQLGLFSSLFVGFNVIADVRFGILERMRVTPVSRGALLVGRLLRDVVLVEVQSVILLLVAALAFGLRAPIGGVLLGLVLVGLLVAALTALSYAAGLITKNEDSFSPLLNFVVVPALLLSGVLLPMSLAPTWLDVISRLNPLRYILDGMRATFLGQYTSAALLGGGIAAVLLTAFAIAFGWTVFVRENN